MTAPDTDTLAGLRYHKLVRGDPGYRDQMCIRADGQWLNRKDAEALIAETIALRAQAAKDKARIERLQAALRPFAKAGELFTAPEHTEFCQVLYAPAAGPDYDITERHVRIARAALEDGE